MDININLSLHLLVLKRFTLFSSLSRETISNIQLRKMFSCPCSNATDCWEPRTPSAHFHTFTTMTQQLIKWTFDFITIGGNFCSSDRSTSSLSRSEVLSLDLTLALYCLAQKGTSPITVTHHGFLVSHTADLQPAELSQRLPCAPQYLLRLQGLSFFAGFIPDLSTNSVPAQAQRTHKRKYFVSQEFVARDVADGWGECDRTKGAAAIIHLIWSQPSQVSSWDRVSRSEVSREDKGLNLSVEGHRVLRLTVQRKLTPFPNV